jgi:SpoVK/Ycf46/Vps4 family AAA+-type ATPase
MEACLKSEFNKRSEKMRIRSRGHWHKNLFNGFAFAINRDKDGIFAIRQCIAYIGRLMPCLPLLDEETLDFIQWLIPEENKNIIQLVTRALSKKEKALFNDEIIQCVKDPIVYPHEISTITRNISRGKVRRLIEQILLILENKRKQLQYQGSTEFEKGMSSLKKMFNLTDGEENLCWLFFICTKWRQAQIYFIGHIELFDFYSRTYLLAVLDMGYREFNAILSGTLYKAGLLSNDLPSLTLAGDFFLDLESSSSEKLTQAYYTRIPQKTIPLEYHQIVKNETEQVLRVLQVKPKSSTHILLYGSPGTGKTTYAQGLAHYLKIPAYQIVQNEHNKTLNRRVAIVASLNMTNQGDGSLIIVDEADNVLNTRNSGFTRGETQDKGWLNQILEEPGVRMIWITNSIDDIEESVLRRFAYSLHFEILNRRQRARLWQGIIESNKAVRFFDSPDLEKLAQRYQVSAGVIDLAVKKAREIKLRTKEKFQAAVILSLDAHERLLAGGEKKNRRESIEKNYSLEGLNIQGDIGLLMQDLEAFDQFLRQPKQAENRNMNLLFYGPPGTGKSELARYIGNRLQREVICKRASDVMDCYVGETEKNIKNTFAEAEREQAILVFDEADSFLFNREMAQRSWEVSFTNEFLTRMERYQGILVCTTNRMTGLDSASIRRFNHKIGFDCLKPEGNAIFYQRLLAPLTTMPLTLEDKDDLNALRELAPGDFRIVRNRYAIMPPERITPEMMIKALHEESRIKQKHNGGKSIGFMR